MSAPSCHGGARTEGKERARQRWHRKVVLEPRVPRGRDRGGKESNARLEPQRRLEAAVHQAGVLLTEVGFA